MTAGTEQRTTEVATPLAFSEPEPSELVVVFRLPLTTVDTVSLNVTVPVGVPLPPPFVTVAVKVTACPAARVRSSGFDDVTLTPTPLSPCTDASVDPLIV